MGLDPLQNYTVSMLYLTIGHWVVECGPIMLNGMSFTKILNFFAGKLCTIILENLVRYAKMQYNAPQKFDCIFFGYPAHLLGFNKFCESINRYNQKSIATLGPWKRTQDVDAPCRQTARTKGSYLTLEHAGESAV